MHYLVLRDGEGKVRVAVSYSIRTEVHVSRHRPVLNVLILACRGEGQSGGRASGGGGAYGLVGHDVQDEVIASHSSSILSRRAHTTVSLVALALETLLKIRIRHSMRVAKLGGGASSTFWSELRG